MWIPSRIVEWKARCVSLGQGDGHGVGKDPGQQRAVRRLGGGRGTSTCRPSVSETHAAIVPCVLILGGTGEARDLAAHLGRRPHIRTVSTLAGRVQRPRLPEGEVRIGGFGGLPGLIQWLRDNHVSAIVDATHPFAERISRTAAEAARRTGTPTLLLR